MAAATANRDNSGSNENNGKHVPADFLRKVPISSEIGQAVHKDSKFNWQPRFVDPVVNKYGGHVRRTFHYVRPHDTFNSTGIVSENKFHMLIITIITIFFPNFRLATE